MLTQFTNLTVTEKKAIRSLQNLAKRWPKSLGLYSIASELFVFKFSQSELGDGMRKDGYQSPSFDPNAVVVEIKNILNDGGDW